MKKTYYFLGALALAGGLSVGVAGVLGKVDEERGPKVAETLVADAPVILHYQLEPLATPLIRGKKVGRYIHVVARYELEGAGSLERAREALPLLRDDLVRSLHMDPVPLVGDGDGLDMKALRERFMKSGKKFLGGDSVQDVTVGTAKKSGFIVRSSEPPPKKKSSGGHGGGHK